MDFRIKCTYSYEIGLRFTLTLDDGSTRDFANLHDLTIFLSNKVNDSFLQFSVNLFS